GRIGRGIGEEDNDEHVLEGEVAECGDDEALEEVEGPVLDDSPETDCNFLMSFLQNG
ncbi:hypothetical protein GOP47_0001293, partial [Adiantum capillus-veneris]